VPLHAPTDISLAMVEVSARKRTFATDLRIRVAADAHKLAIATPPRDPRVCFQPRALNVRFLQCGPALYCLELAQNLFY
jgi:hypothetical protein